MSTSLKGGLGQDARFSSVLSRNAPVTQGERAYVATQWQLMWWRFRRHKVAMAGGLVTILIFAIAAAASLSISAWFIMDVRNDDSAERAADELMNEYALDY